MKTTMTKLIGSTILGLTLLACGSSTSDTTSTDSSTADSNVGAAVSAVFGGSSQSASLNPSLTDKLASILIRQAQAQSGPPTSACDSLSETPSDITMSTSITAGTYGLTSNSVTVTADDGCAEGGEYVGFTVTAHAMVCEDGSGNTQEITMENCTGVWRINSSTLLTEIYGTFSMSTGSETASDIKCSFTIDNSAGPDGELVGSCEDASGNAVSQASDASCSDA